MFAKLPMIKREEIMDCTEVTKRLSAWADDELSEGQAQRVNHHLEQCPACRREAQAYRRVVAALNALPTIAAPGRFARKTLKAFRAGLDQPNLVQWWRQLSLAMRGALCGIALAGLLCGGTLAASLTNLSADSAITPYQTLYASQGMLP